MSGILYFQRISDANALKNAVEKWQPFEKLCTKDSRPTKALVTTMWNELDYESGVRLETALKMTWSRMVTDSSSVTCRFVGTRLSAFQILLPSIRAANEKQTGILLLGLKKVHHHLIEAGTRDSFFQELCSIISRQREILDSICIELDRILPNESSLKPLIQEHQELTKKLRSRLDFIKTLKLPLSKRLLDTLLVVVSWNWFRRFANIFPCVLQASHDQTGFFISHL